MLKINLPARFCVGQVLPLPGLLLDQLIGHKKSHFVVRHGDSQAFSAGEIALVGGRKARSISPVGEVLQHGWIEVAIAMKSVQARREPVRTSKDGDACGPIRSRKASAARIQLAVGGSEE